MKNFSRLLSLALLLAGMAIQVRGQGTAFTYQGRLSAAGTQANGSYDFQFGAWTSAAGGVQLGATWTNSAVAVSNGLFEVTLDFGAIYTGGAVWLNLSVRPHGSGSFTELSPRQDMTPAPYAVYAGTAATTHAVSGFAGSLAGNVTGKESATVVSTVGAQTAANVAAGVVLANAATGADTVNTIVRRDRSGSFTASTITASGFSGSGASLTSLNAANVTAGTLPTSVLPASVAQLGILQTFTGINTFANAFVFAPGNGTLTIDNDSGIVPGIVAQGGNVPGHARFRNALEVWPSVAATSGGYLDVRNTGGNPSIVLTGQAGTVAAASFSGSGSSLTGTTVTALGNNEITSAGGQNGVLANTNIYLNNLPLYLRSDQNHGLAYNGAGVTNFPSGTVLPDGPVLWGYTGGALGVLNGGAQSALSWNNSGVGVNNALNVAGNANVAGNLTANNLTVTGSLNVADTGGPTWIQTALINTNSYDDLDLSGVYVLINPYRVNEPAPGYLVITISMDIAGSGTIYLEDITSGSKVNVDNVVYSASFGTVVMTWVYPYPTPGATLSFELDAVPTLYGSGLEVAGLCFNTMFFPRLND
jgi:hypothetical protein